MSLTINYPDKIIGGLNQSYTLLSDEGTPTGKVSVEGTELPHRVILLGPPKDSKESTTLLCKYKVSFLLPRDAVGKNVRFQFQAGSSRVEESKPVTEF